MADSRERVGGKERRPERERERSRARSERSYDSDEERRQRRRRREKEGREEEGRRERRDEEGGRRERRDEEGGRRERRDEEGGRERRGAKDDDRDAKRRRSRSPRGGESERKHRRERGHRPHRERDRDPKQRSRSPRPRSRDRDSTRPAEAAAQAVTRKSAGPLPSQAASFSQTAGGAGDMVVRDGPAPAAVEKQQPNFAATGLLAAATKTVETEGGSAVVLKYHEPSEARKPAGRDAWKLFVFKDGSIVETVELGQRSCWLVGREVAVADLAAAHPSVSKQHAVVQFRYVERRNEFGDRAGRVRPYLMDLESANGTRLNGEVVESARYVELRDGDMVQFGDSTREYVVMLPPKD